MPEQTNNVVQETAQVIQQGVQTASDTITITGQNISEATDKIIAQTGTVADLAAKAGESDVLATLEDKIVQLINTVSTGLTEHGAAGWDLLMLPLRIHAAQALVTGLILLILGGWLVNKGFKKFRYAMECYKVYQRETLSELEDTEMKDKYLFGKGVNDSPYLFYPCVLVVVGAFTIVTSYAEVINIMNWVQVFVPEVKFADMLMQKFLG